MKEIYFLSTVFAEKIRARVRLPIAVFRYEPWASGSAYGWARRPSLADVLDGMGDYEVPAGRDWTLARYCLI